jgi:hypothetical protein
MRWTGAAAIALCLAMTPCAHAGVYWTDSVGEQVIPGPLSLQQFDGLYGRYFAAGSPQAPIHYEYLARAKRLEARQREPFGLSTDERINLSFDYIRVQQPDKAVEVLKPVESERNFMVHANLATALHMSSGAERGRLERAADYLEIALKEWPSTWPGMTQRQLSWFYRVERYYQTLLRARIREERLAPGKIPDTLDELFPGVRFVGADGTYQAGSIDPRQYARLPTDALMAVQQLLLWMPADERLTWLLAELLNAEGYVPEAWKTLDHLSDKRRYSPRELKEHHHVLNDVSPVLKEASLLLAWHSKMAANGEYFRLLWAVSPRGGTAPGASGIANEIANGATLALGTALTPKPEKPKDEEPMPPAPAAKARTDSAQLPSLTHVVVSFLAGVAITLLAGMQVREMRRRREHAPAKG